VVTLLRPVARLVDVRRWPWWVQTLAVYAAGRAWLVVVFVQVARLQQENLWTEADPGYSDYVALMFDGTWYRRIAEEGYPPDLPTGPDGVVQQNAWAFFPAFPLLVRWVMAVTHGSWAAVAPVVATLLGAAAVLVIHRVVVRGAPRAVEASPGLPLAVVALVGAFPTAPVLQAAYTESLALLLVAAVLWAVLARRYALAGLLVLLLGLTRAVALPMAAVVVAHWIHRWVDDRRGSDTFGIRDRVMVGALALLGVVSGFLWPWYVGWRTGVPDAYLLTQESWRGLRSVVPFIGWTYVPTFWFGAWGPLVAGAGIAVVLALLATRSARRLGPELWTWSAGYLGYLIAVVEPGPSLARFLLLAFPMAAASAGLVTEPARWRRAWLAVLMVVMLVLQVVWVRQIWLFNPQGDWPP
jgi:hypothetical protein